MNCTNCGATIGAGQRFCANCGTTAPPAVAGGQQCASCGAFLAPGLAFCTNCGAPVGVGPATPPPVGRACSACGIPLAPGLAFCTNCGSPVGVVRPQAYAYPPAPRRSSGGGGGVVALVVLIGILVVGIAGGAWWYTQNQNTSQTVAAAVTPAPGQTQAPAKPSGGLTLPGGLSLPVIGATVVPSPTPTPSKPVFGKAEIKNPDPAKLVTSKELGEAPANQVGVILKDGMKRTDADRVATELGGTIIGEIEFMSMYQIETKGATEADLNASLEKARRAQGVEVAFPNKKMAKRGIPCIDCGALGDPTYAGGNGRAFEMIGLSKAWKVLKASGIKLGDVHVGILDEALSRKSDEFGGQSIVDGDTTAGDINHGTQVAGVVGANGSNGGITGVASPLGNKLKISVTNIYDAQPDYTESAPDPNDPTKVVRSDGKTYIFKTFVQIINQIQNGATIINGSYGPANLSPANASQAAAYKQFLTKMAQKYPKVLFVAASGNSNQGTDGNNDIWGHKLPNLITVSALDGKGGKAGFSNFAAGDGEVTISAPGVDLPVHIGPDGKPVKSSGTSFASPQVAAAAALIRSINPDLSAEQIKNLLVVTARKDVQNSTDKSTTMTPTNMGAGVLRVDLAVIKAINDMLPKDKQIDDKRLEQLASIEGSADAKNPMEFTVKAKVQAVGNDGTSVKIELKEGKGAIVTGAPAHKLSAPGEVSWEIKLVDPKSAPIAHICRLDTDACCDVKLQVIDLAGEWKGTWTITDVDVASDITIPDPFDDKKPPQVIKKEDCEKAIQASMNKANQIKLEFKPTSPEAGTAIMTTIDDKGKESKSDPLQYTFDGARVKISGSKQGSVITFEGNVTATDTEYKMEGPFRMTMTGDKGAESLKISGVFAVVKPAPQAAPAAAPKPAAKP